MIDVLGDGSGPVEVPVGQPAELPKGLPVLPLRGNVPFPDTLTPLAVGQERSVALVNDALAGNRMLVMVASKDAENETPAPGDLYDVGVAGVIARMIKVPDGTLRILVQGGQRVRINRWLSELPWLVAEIEPVPEIVGGVGGAHGADAQRAADVLGDRRAGALPARGAPGRRRQRRRRERAEPPDRGRAAHQRRGQAGAARGGRRGQAAAPPHRAARARARGDLDRLEDPVPGSGRVRLHPARVLPAPAAQGDPGRAGGGGRVGGGGRGAARAARRARPRRRRAPPGRPRAQPAREAPARRGRARDHPHLAGVDRVAAVGQRAPRTTSTSCTRARCSTPTTTTSRR